MRVLFCCPLMSVLNGLPPPSCRWVDAKKVAEYLKTLSAVPPPVYDAAPPPPPTARACTYAISCTDPSRERRTNRHYTYLWHVCGSRPQLLDATPRTRNFYELRAWHSAGWRYLGVDVASFPNRIRRLVLTSPISRILPRPTPLKKPEYGW